MRPGASRLCFVAIALGVLAIPIDHLHAAPIGARGGFAAPAAGFGPIGHVRPIVRPGFHGRQGSSLRTDGRFGRTLLHSRGGRFGHDYGYGFGGFGLPIGYGYGSWTDDGRPAEQETSKPGLPVAIGIPASPVQPPAIYVIGTSPKGAASIRRPRPGSAGTSGQAASKLASAPRFVSVPSGR